MILTHNEYMHSFFMSLEENNYFEGVSGKPSSSSVSGSKGTYKLPFEQIIEQREEILWEGR